MHMKVKRLAAMLAAVVVLMTFLAACANDGGSSASGGSSATTSAGGSDSSASQPAEGGSDPLGKYDPPITLRGAYYVSSGTMFVPGNPDYESAEKNLFITDYKEQLGIDVVYDWVSADVDAYNTKWNMAMAQGNLPDFGLVNEAQYKMLLEANLVMDMTDIFEEYASDKYKQFVEADGGATMGYSTQNGRLMGLPLTGAQPDTVPLLYIRQDWLDALDLEVPQTIDDLEAVAQAFIDNKMGGDGTYGIVGSKNAFDYDLSFRGIFNGHGAYPGAWIQDGNGGLVYGSTTDAMKEPLLRLQAMFKAGLINEDFAVTDSSIAKEDVASGKVGIAFGTFYLAPGINDNINADPEAEWSIVEMPTIDGEPGVAQSSVSRTQFIFVNKDCANPEAVLKVVNLGIELIYNDDPEVVSRHTTHLVGEDMIQASKYVATVFYCQIPWQNMNIYRDVVKALETGEQNWTVPISSSKYELALQFEAGDRQQWGQYHIFGPPSSFAVIEKMWDDGRIILDEYQSLQTDTMTAKRQILDDALKTAMIKVIMGEDISVYEQAVQDWYGNGGQLMTDEVNEWYSQK